MFNLVSTGLVYAIAIFIMDENVQLNRKIQVKKNENKIHTDTIYLYSINNLPNKLRLKMPNSNVFADRSLCNVQFSSLNVNLSLVYDLIFDNNDTTYTNLTVQNH